MVTLKTFVFNPFRVNSFVAYDETGECIIIDASCSESYEYAELFRFIDSASLKPLAVLNTHGHVDHLTGTAKVCGKYGIPFRIHGEDEFLVDRALESGMMFGLKPEKPPRPDSPISDGETIRFGNTEVQAFHAPGHSPGSVVFYFREEGLLVTGDVLFAGSIGRTDLPGGDYDQLIKSIRSKILVLPGETKVFPGHGPETTVERERLTNPFLNRSY